MDIFCDDESLAELITSQAKCKKRFGAESAENINKGLAAIDAADSLDQIASLRRPKTVNCMVTKSNQFCLQVDDRHTLTFKTVTSQGASPQQELEVIRLDISCPNFASGASHG